jgi:hypothetical protein
VENLRFSGGVDGRIIVLMSVLEEVNWSDILQEGALCRTFLNKAMCLLAFMKATNLLIG